MAKRYGEVAFPKIKCLQRRLHISDGLVLGAIQLGQNCVVLFMSVLVKQLLHPVARLPGRGPRAHNLNGLNTRRAEHR